MCDGELVGGGGGRTGCEVRVLVGGHGWWGGEWWGFQI